jgi:deoxyribodipyrimidine photo-lyase
MSSSDRPIQLVWFKRDLRVHDHAPLAAAAAHGPLLPLYVIEPELLGGAECSTAHWRFIRPALLELRENLARLGAPLLVRSGDILTVLRELREQIGFAAIWAHEETGTSWTYARDRAVRRWARDRGIRMRELPQFGVVRRLTDRDGWDRRWEQFMQQPQVPTPAAITPAPLALEPGPIPPATDLTAQVGLRDEGVQRVQRGGEAAGLRVLAEFLQRRGEYYHSSLSSPATAVNGCSRLSPHFAWGTVSLRRAVQELRRRQAAVALDPAAGSWPRALAAFASRLHWHCHFVQKLEDEPTLGARNLVRAFDGLREGNHDPTLLAAWAAGETGQPLVDACMRSLRATGWLNFRMRAMVVSYLSFDLWQHWDLGGALLARLFTDYEPGIHYAQLQMQSGTAGNTVLRIYNPQAQAQQHDPQGNFIRRWVPELAALPTTFIHAPWLMPIEQQRALGVIIGTHYPAPLVDHATAYRAAREAIAALRAGAEARRQIADVRQRHGSRRREPPRSRSRITARGQLSLPLGES